MGWIERDADKHKHNNPKTGPIDAEVGDIWECSCGLRFRVTTVKKNYDQRDGNFSSLTWVPDHSRRSATEPASYPAPPAGDNYFGPYGYGSQDR